MDCMSDPAGGASVRNRVKVPIHLRSTGHGYKPEMVTFHGLCDGLEHLALVFAPWVLAPMVRVHSECLTGDVFGSARCDCGQQLEESIELLGHQGGILLYLRQEGRGIGLYNKLDAYHLQILQGLDTYAANRALNFPDDLREFRVAAQILHALGVREISLITNNPDKIAQLSKHGIHIREALLTGVFSNPLNQRYLRAKVAYHNHSIKLCEDNL